MVWAKLVHAWPQRTGKFIAAAVLSWSVLVLLTRKSPSLTLPTSSILIVTIALCKNFAGFMVIRFALGLVESIIGPVFVILTSNWWTRSEQAFRACVWLSGTPVSGLMSSTVEFTLTLPFQIGNFLGGILSYALGSSMFSPRPTLSSLTH